MTIVAILIAWAALVAAMAYVWVKIIHTSDEERQTQDDEVARELGDRYESVRLAPLRYFDAGANALGNLFFAAVWAVATGAGFAVVYVVSWLRERRRRRESEMTAYLREQDELDELGAHWSNYQ